VVNKNEGIVKKLVLMIIFGLAINVYAQDKPIQIALFSPLQIFAEEYDITGVRLNLLYGKNSSVTGLDVGLANRTSEKMSYGVQFGVLGIAERGFTGWQYNTVNVCHKEFSGFQLGLVNFVEDGNGFMLGVVNYARRLKGLQIGLFNLIEAGGVAPVLPIVNWAF
jgi:hypothetical protein